MAVHYGREKRRFFRLIYPQTNCPAMRFWEDWNKEYPVREISEGSIVFHADNPGNFLPGQSISAFVCFRQGKTDPIKGIILRIRGNRVIVVLNQGISLQRVSEEEVILDLSQGA
ncbi:MAG TPA: hypothetical protein VHV83_13305 [Armatimonadota bacterium]|nr:hypothetical protein [Armatimonadota bacterium]